MKNINAILQIQKGDSLVAQKTMCMEDTGEQVFTLGKRYLVIQVLPLKDPPTVMVFDDSESANQIDTEFISNFVIEKA